MSDFDEEAERERLREQFERDREKREASERMSELLLKGATMTNAHCDACGDPIFRYEGQEFCPTCQQPVGDGAEAAEGAADAEQPAEAAGENAGADAGGADARADPDAGAEAGADARTDAPAESASAEAGGGVEDARAEGVETADVPSPDQYITESTTEPGPEADLGEQGQDHPDQPDRSRTSAERPAGAASRGPDLDAATQSLARTLTRMARAAEGTDDVARKREYLQAAREAAEALAAARRAR